MDCTIRPMRETDLSDLCALLSDAEVMRWIEPPFSREQTKDFLEKAGLSVPPLIYAAEDAGGEFIGYVIYHDYDGENKEIGWLLKREAWGKGYAQALTARMLKMAGAEGKGAVIECAPAQAATKHIARKFGFACRGNSGGCDVYFRARQQTM